MQAFLAQHPNPAAWTLDNLKAHNLEFVITKEAVAVHGPREASVFPVIIDKSLKDASSVLTNESALQQLGVSSFQEAIDPGKWPKVSGSTKYSFVVKDGKEFAIKQRGGAAKALGRILVVVSIIIETAFFIIQWEQAENKVVHCAQYATNLGLIIGGYFACEAVSAAMVTAGFSGLVTGLATFGLGLVFCGIC